MRRLLVVGFGNPLQGDDGAGPAVVARLLAGGLPAGCRAVDGGADALRLPDLWRGEEEVLLVDAVASGAPPGTVHRLDHEALLGVAQRHATAHYLSLPESLRWIALAYPDMARVRYRMWGIEAARVALGSGLSPAVAAAVEQTAEEIAAVCLSWSAAADPSGP